MEVAHVRARRGQSTDSHSLAEKVLFLIPCFIPCYMPRNKFSIPNNPIPKKKESNHHLLFYCNTGYNRENE